MGNLGVCVTEWGGDSVQEGVGAQSVAGPGGKGRHCPETKPQINVSRRGRAVRPGPSFREPPAAARPGQGRLLVASVEHLVAGGLMVLLQKVKILRALPNSKKLEAHWEGGSLATQMPS